MKEKFTLQIGNLSIALNTSDATFRRMLEQRYAGFLVPEAHPSFHFDVKIAAPMRSALNDDLQVSRQDGWWRVERGDFSASWEEETRRGWIRQSASPYAADTLLRIVHSIVLAETGGFLLHAASAVRNDRAFLFSGISGAGKTTMARLAPRDARLLTDEMSYVTKGPGGFCARGTPFAGELGRAGENIAAPITGLYLLEKAKENRLERLDRGTALRGLLRNILFLANDTDLVNRVFDSAAKFVSGVPVYRMHFTPDAGAWEMIV